MNVTIHLPQPPYPNCKCNGQLVPCLEPATARDSWSGRPGWVKDSIILYWICIFCKERIA